MLVYFHIDELARDSVVASALKKQLEKENGKLVYGNRLTTRFLLKYFNIFDAIILPSLRHFTEVFTDIENLPKNIFILQTEAIGQATGTLRRLNGKYFGDNAEQCAPWHKAVSGFLLWGHAHKNPFTQIYPEYLSKCKVVGHPRLSDACSKPSDNIGQKSKPVIGLVSRFNLLNPHDCRLPFESVSGTMRFRFPDFPIFENSPDKDIEDMFYTEVIDFRVMLEIILSLDTDKYDISVRPHPRENRNGWYTIAEKLNLKITISDWDEPFGHWLNKLDFIVTPPSTSLYDIYFHGKSAIVTNDLVASRAAHILTESDDRNQILEGVCKPKSVKEILNLIDSGKIPYDKEIIQLRLNEQVGADVARNSTENIIQAISELRDSSNPFKYAISHRYYYYQAVSLLLSHIRWVKGKLTGRTVQGANFDLTLGKCKWIDRLTGTN
jgi:hypothetical protein